jgi:hypothetical protein
MQPLTHQRCLNHANREAVAQCPECMRFFCRECVTEHEDRVVCSLCLRKLARLPLTRRRAFARALQLARCGLGLLIAWFFFFLIGEGLVRVPDSFHEGTLWKISWFDQE